MSLAVSVRTAASSLKIAAVSDQVPVAGPTPDQSPPSPVAEGAGPLSVAALRKDYWPPPKRGERDMGEDQWTTER